MQTLNLKSDDGAAEARLIHPGNDGWFAIMRRLPSGKWMSRCHSLSVVELAAQAVSNQPDVYISQASFTAPKRRLAYLSKLRSAWVDLDCYNVGAQPSREFIDEIIGRAVAVGLPEPTYVVRSGRGLYAKWIFDREIHAANMPVWQSLQATLVAVFRALGADPKARDAARVLRTLGSLNSKVHNGDPVHIAWTSAKTCDFDALCLRASMIEPEVAQRMADPCLSGGQSKQDRAQRLENLRSKTRELAQMCDSICHLGVLDTYASTREPIMLPRRSSRALNWRRFLDLRQLAHMRCGVHRGSRDSFLFWMMTFLSHAGVVNAANFWAELQCLSGFIQADDYQPMTDGSMGSLYERLKRGLGHQGQSGPQGLYTATSDKIIDLLQITPQEQEQLLTIISPEEKQRRSDLKAPGRAEKRQQLNNARSEVELRLGENMPVAQIQTETGVSKRQIYRWRDARRLRNERPDAVQANGRARRMASKSIDAHLLTKVSDALAMNIQGSTVRQTMGLSESAMRRVMQRLRHERGQSTKPPPALDPQALQLQAELTQSFLRMRNEYRVLCDKIQDARQALNGEMTVVRLKDSIRRRFGEHQPTTTALASNQALGSPPQDEAMTAAMRELSKMQAEAKRIDQNSQMVYELLEAQLIDARDGVRRMGTSSNNRTRDARPNRTPGPPGQTEGGAAGAPQKARGPGLYIRPGTFASRGKPRGLAWVRPEERPPESPRPSVSPRGRPIHYLALGRASPLAALAAPATRASNASSSGADRAVTALALPPARAPSDPGARTESILERSFFLIE